MKLLLKIIFVSLLLAFPAYSRLGKLKREPKHGVLFGDSTECGNLKSKHGINEIEHKDFNATVTVDDAGEKVNLTFNNKTFSFTPKEVSEFKEIDQNFTFVIEGCEVTVQGMVNIFGYRVRNKFEHKMKSPLFARKALCKTNISKV